MEDFDLDKCEIHVDDSGWYVQLLGGAIVQGGFVSCGDAVEEAQALGLTITNMDDVERWMQPPDDWGLIEAD